jgi:hypothetical protein
LWFRFVVGGDGNPVLAAEPMFHGEAPGGGLLVVIADFHGSYGLAITPTEQSENGFSGFDRDLKPVSRLMEAA